jgi:hypothetical protein
MITQKYLKECLHYDPDTGLFTWAIRPEGHFKTLRDCNAWNTRYSKTEAGGHQKRRHAVYRIIGLNDASWLAHRLAWLYTYGEFPKDQIDHKDGDGTNNRITNLRDVSNQENHKNISKPSSNKSGCIGVHFESRRGKWRAGIKTGTRQKHLGYFTDIEEAVEVRKAAELEFGYHENHGREK